MGEDASVPASMWRVTGGSQEKGCSVSLSVFLLSPSPDPYM